MATTAKLVSHHPERSKPLLARIADRFSIAVRCIAAGRYAEQRERIAKTGSAGMVW